MTSVPDEDEIEDASTISSTQNKSMATDKGVQSFQRDVPPHMDIPGMRQNKGKGKETIGEYDSVRRSHDVYTIRIAGYKSKSVNSR